MFISPRVAYENGWISNVLNPNQQIGSDGIDLTVSKVHQVATSLRSVITESKSTTVHRDLAPIQARPVCESPVSQYLTEQLHIDPQLKMYFLSDGVYDIEFNEFIELPAGVAAILCLRSTFVRAGHKMFSGLYDQGFKNYAGAVFHCNGVCSIEERVRMAQIVFIHSVGSGQMYAGGYNYQAGDNHWFDTLARQQ